MSIEQILKNTNYHLDLFSDSEIAALESCITTKQSNGQAISTDDLLKIPIALPSEEIAEEIVRRSNPQESRDENQGDFSTLPSALLRSRSNRTSLRP